MARRPLMLVVDDDPLILESMTDIMGKKGYDVRPFRQAQAALDEIRGGAVDIVVVDLKMPGMDGLELLRSAKTIDNDLPIVMMTAYSTIGTAVQAMKHGACDYVQKPFDIEELDLVARRALEERRLHLQQDYLARRQSADLADRELVGTSQQIRRVHEMIQKVAPSDSTVLITGESGTGKELVARHIHQYSPRRRRLFVAVNAAAVPAALLESELFGHAKGSFTSADRDRKGLFQTADGATLFLDEIAETPLAMQTKLLRVIEDNEVRPVGSSRSIHVDVRLVASTNADLAQAVRDGRFRGDLFYRLNVFPIHMPPLRQRIEDVPLLAEHFLRRYSSRARKPLHSISPEAMALLMDYDWPGNVRELEHVIERAVLLEDRPEITPESLSLSATTRAPAAGGLFDDLLDKSFHHAKAIFEKEYVLTRVRAAQQRGETMSTLAERLGVHRTTLYGLMERHGINLRES